MVKFSLALRQVLETAGKIAAFTGGQICTEHLLLAISKQNGCFAQKLLSDIDITSDYLENFFEKQGVCVSVEMSPNAGLAVECTRELAQTVFSQEACPEHLLFTILEEKSSVACRLIEKRTGNVDAVLKKLYDYFVVQSGGKIKKKFSVDFSPNNEFENTYDNSGKNNNLKNINTGGSQFLRNEFDKYFSAVYSKQKPETSLGKAENNAQKDGNAKVVNLALLGTDLTAKARENKFDPVIGRQKELERVIQILARRTKNNPVLVGEPGVGKSAVVEGLAQAIASGNVPDMLRDKTLFSLDLTSLVAGTRYRGDFEEKFKSAIDEIKKRGNIILFIDEIHTMLKAGSSEGGLDVANILKPALARGELQTIGATTIDEYRKQFEKDPALERRFQPVTVDEPTQDDAIQILQGLKEKYEKHHGVIISDDAIKSAVKFSVRYIHDRYLPDKAIDLIDEACSRKKLGNYSAKNTLVKLESEIVEKGKEIDDANVHGKSAKAAVLCEELKVLLEKHDKLKNKISNQDGAKIVDEEDIAEILEDWTGVPVNKIAEGEGRKLLDMEAELNNRVVGQTEAVSAVAQAVKRARTGLKDPKRPIGSFLFLGTTGVGKTELSKALAEVMFGDEQSLIRMDMSEYMQKENVSKLLGAAPGLVGFEEGGLLTEKVRRKPYSVVLFDEIEKADSEVFNILLQILDDGILTDGQGRQIDFKNTIIILTSNLGAAKEKYSNDAFGFGMQGKQGVDEYAELKKRQLSALKKAVKPELINRIDDIIVFKKLDKQSVSKIADIQINALISRLKEKSVSLSVTEKAKELLVNEGYDAEYGARPLKRVIQKYVGDRISEMILSGSLLNEDKLLLDGKDEKLLFVKQK